MENVIKALIKCIKEVDELREDLFERIRALQRSGFYATYDTEQMSIYYKIIMLNTRREQLLNLKKFATDMVHCLHGPDKYILDVCYLNDNTVDKAAEILNINKRTLYRQLDKILLQFREYLSNQGCDKDKILSMFGDEPLFKSLWIETIKRSQKK